MGNDALQGALELVVLKTLSRAPVEGMHGFGIALAVEAGSSERLRLEEGSLYPALHRMERQGWVGAAWGRTENGRRARYYRLTAAGRRELARQQGAWRRTAGALAAFLGA